MSEQREVLAERYVLISELGRGGMGVVWRAFDMRLKRYVAIKQINLGSNRQLANRFEREAEITAGVNHPNIVKIHDVFQEGGRHFAVMELIDGAGLDRLIEDGSLTPDSIRRIMLAIASALAVAHRHGVAHRDVKPPNIIVDLEGIAHLVDFGISRTMDQTRITEAGAVIGTLAYMPPEVALSEDATFASDMWALGATIYCCFEGRPPFMNADHRMNMHALLSGDPPRPTRAGELTEIVERLLRRSPTERPTAPDVVAHLETLRPVPPPPVPPPPVPPGPSDRSTVFEPVPPRPEPPHPSDRSTVFEPVPPQPDPDQPEPGRRGVPRGRLIAMVVAAVVLITGASVFVLVQRSSTSGGGAGAGAGGTATVQSVPSSPDSAAASPPSSAPTPAGGTQLGFRPLTEVDIDGRLARGGDVGSAADPKGTGSALCPATTTVAIAGALTGVNSALGINVLNGAKLAIDKHNTANPGCQVQLKPFDTQGEPTKATSVAPQIVNDPNVLALLGPVFSGETAATGPVFSQAGLLSMTPSATNPTLTTHGWSNFFRGLGNDTLQGTAVARYMTGPLKFDKVCVVQDDSLYGTGLAGEVTSVLGPTADSSCAGKVKSTAADFEPVTELVKKAGADAVYYAGYYPEAATFVGQLRAAGVATAFFTGDGSLDPEFIAQAGGSATGTYSSCPCGPTSDVVAADYLLLNGVRPGIYAAEAYDLTTIMLTAIDSGINDRAGMVEYVKNYDGQGIARHYQWDSAGELTGANLWIYQVQ